LSKDKIPMSFLQSGNDLIVSKYYKCKHPTYEEVMSIDEAHNGLYSEEMYYSYVSLFLTDPYEYMVFLDDHGIDYEQSSFFEVFKMLFDSYCKKMEEKNVPNEYNVYYAAFQFFFGVDSFSIIQVEDLFAFIDKDNHLIFSSKDFEYIAEFIKKMNGIPDGERINPENEMYKQILIEDKRDEMKRKMRQKKENDEDDNKDRLGKLLSALTWGGNGNVTPFNRKQLHLYDLVEGINRTDKKLNFQNTMNGYYSGCIEKKDIDFNKIHWTS